MSKVTGARVALGYQARVGKDTFADGVQRNYGAHRVSFAQRVYEISEQIQRIIGRPVKKDAGLLQTIGAGMRRHYGDDVWATGAMQQIDAIIAADAGANIIVTDMRYPNEMEQLKARGFVTVKITRPGRPVDRDEGHESETALEAAAFDHHIENDGSIEEFIAKIDAFMQKKDFF